MKQILGLLVAVAVVVFGANHYYVKQVEKQLHSAASAVRMVGGELEYGDVSITTGGDLRIDDVLLSFAGAGESFNAERVVLKTGGVFGVHTLAMDIRGNRMPAQLGLSVEGMRMPTSWQGQQQLNLFNAYDVEGVSVAGCGDWARFSEKDFAEMGYGDWVSMDTRLHYRLVGEGDALELVIDTEAQDMHQVAMTVELALGAASRDISAINRAMINAKLHQVQLDYTDRGFASRVLDFCQTKAGLERSEFLAHHLAAWQEAWRDSGFLAGDSLLTAYGKFLNNPDRVSLTAKPFGELSLMEISNLTPELLPYEFQTELSVNGEAVGRLDITATETAPVVAATTHTTRTKPIAKVEASAQRQRLIRNTRPQPIAVEQLQNHLNDVVILRMASGNVLEGRVRRIEGGTLQMHSYYSGGSMTIPVPLGQILEAHLK